MIDNDIRHLANLARIEVSDEDLKNYSREFNDILDFIDQIKSVENVDQENMVENASVRNIFREDDLAQESGIYKEDLLNCAPDKKDNYVKVQKILNVNDSA